MLRNVWLCFFPQGMLRMTVAGPRLWVFGLRTPLAQGIVLGSTAGGSWGRKNRSRNDGSGCISSLRKGCPPEMQGKASELPSYSAGSSRSSQPTPRSPQNHSWILCACFKLLKEISSRCKVAMLFNGKFLPFYSLELIYWTVILVKAI